MSRPSPTVPRALIPCAGRGTRMRPISTLLPKELVPLGTTPALRFVVEEAWEAGIRDIGIVHRAEKPLLESYLRDLEASGELEDVRFTFVEQPEPRGLAEAIACARDFLADDPFALLLPDNWLPSPDYRLRDLLTLHERAAADVIGVLELDHSHSGRFGNCGRIESELDEDAGELAGRALHLRRLEGKGEGTIRIAPGETIRRTCGRSVCGPWIHDYTDRIRPQIEGEFSEVPIYQRIIEERGARGLVLPGPVFDLGNPDGYLAACAWLWQTRSGDDVTVS